MHLAGAACMISPLSDRNQIRSPMTGLPMVDMGVGDN